MIKATALAFVVTTSTATSFRLAENSSRPAATCPAPSNSKSSSAVVPYVPVDAHDHSTLPRWSSYLLHKPLQQQWSSMLSIVEGTPHPATALARLSCFPFLSDELVAVNLWEASVPLYLSSLHHFSALSAHTWDMIRAAHIAMYRE